MNYLFDLELTQTLRDLAFISLVVIVIILITYTIGLAVRLHKAEADLQLAQAQNGGMLDQQFDDMQQVEFYRNETNRIRLSEVNLSEELDALKKDNAVVVKAYNKLEAKYTRRNQPRVNGKFGSTPRIDPKAGRYECVFEFIMNFTYGKFYERFESKELDQDKLYLVGDDLMRHDVTEYKNWFQIVV